MLARYLFFVDFTAVQMHWIDNEGRSIGALGLQIWSVSPALHLVLYRLQSALIYGCEHCTQCTMTSHWFPLMDVQNDLTLPCTVYTLHSDAHLGQPLSLVMQQQFGLHQRGHVREPLQHLKGSQ